MNYSSFISKLGGAVLAVVTSGLIFTSAQAQTPGPNVYFDPSNAGNGTTGGSGDFSTSSFWNGSTDAPFVSGSNSVGAVTPGEGAIFNGPASTVTVSAPVSPDYLEVGVTSGTETFGTTGSNANEITFPMGFAYAGGGSNFLNPIQIDSGTENVVFNSGVNLAIFNRYYNNGNTVNSYTSGNVAFNGGITFTNNTSPATTDAPGQGMGEPDMDLTSNTPGGTFTINSAVSLVNSPGSYPVINGNIPYVALTSDGSTLTLTSNASFADVTVQAQAGTIIDDGASFSNTVGYTRQIFAGGTGQYLTGVAGMTVTEGVQFSNGGGTVGSALAATTTYSGEIVGYSGADMNLTSGAGGRVNFTGDVVNGNGFGINKVGVGTINIANANPYSENQGGSWDIKNGTMLLNGTVASNTAITGSHLTIDAVAPGAISGTQTYATLGGNGSTNVPIVAAGGTSIIAPGDPTVAGGIGELTLAGGLNANNGATFQFQLNGVKTNTYDQLAFAGSSLSATNVTAPTLTFDLSNIGGALTDAGGSSSLVFNAAKAYTLFTGIGTGSAFGTDNFVFDAPAGYYVSNYQYNALSGTFAVDLREVPEPSTYALMGLGMLVLIATVRSRKLRA